MKSDRAPVYKSVKALKAWIDRETPGRVVLANGCFDPLHVGHIRYLYGAKSHGDFLVVALNDDASTRNLKGANRPVMPVSARVKLISSLEMVDAVVIFSGRNVARVLRTLLPAFHAMGTDYTVETVPERELSKSLGIETVIVGDPKTHASKQVMEKIRGFRNGRGESTR